MVNIVALLATRRNPFRWLPLLSFIAAVFSLDDAQAIIQGRSSGLGSQTVRIVGRGGDYCTGVVLSRTLVATAAHCAGRSVIADGGSVPSAGITRSAVLDDGRQVHVSGDAVIIRLSTPLSGASPISIGTGSGGSYTIAGYGTTEEQQRGAFGGLHEASVVPASRYALVDPQRSGSISASACFGDSGGPVMRGSELVGIISRAAHPSPRIACGYLTRWSPIYVSGSARETTGVASPDGEAISSRRKRHCLR